MWDIGQASCRTWTCFKSLSLLGEREVRKANKENKRERLVASLRRTSIHAIYCNITKKEKTGQGVSNGLSYPTFFECHSCCD